jgi:hypothetical protein
MDHQEKQQWNEKWFAQLDKAIADLVELSHQINLLESEIEGINSLISLILSQIEPEPPA